MPRTRVHNLNISLDGYAAGDHVTFDAPIGGAERLFGWFDGRAIHGVDQVDAPFTLDHALTSLWSQGIGAEIMGRRKFGPQVGPWPDDEWRGWWGDEPPFRTPVFVLSHHPHPTIDFPNGTSFQFLDGPPHEVLRVAQEAAEGRDVRIGGGPSTGASVSRGRPDRLHAFGRRADHSWARRTAVGRIRGCRGRLHGRVSFLTEWPHSSALEQEPPLLSYRARYPSAGASYGRWYARCSVPEQRRHTSRAPARSDR